MNRLDILKALLINEKSSIYKLQKILKENRVSSNYTTVWRYVKRMQKEGLLITTQDLRKNGKSDERETEILDLSLKGLATVLIEGDLQEEELWIIGTKSLEKDFSKVEPSAKTFMTDVFSDSLSALKPKVNLEFFDEKWFRDVYLDCILEACAKAKKKYQVEFEKEGIWETEKEIRDRADELINSLKELNPRNVFQKP